MFLIVRGVALKNKLKSVDAKITKLLNWSIDNVLFIRMQKFDRQRDNDDHHIPYAKIIVGHYSYFFFNMNLLISVIIKKNWN